MSRDWTPRQLLTVDMARRNAGQPGFLDMNFDWVSPDGTKTPLMSRDELRFRKEYPILGLTCNPLWTWYTSKSDKERAVEIIARFEKELSEFVDEKRLPATVVEKWFAGELDPAFYYCERNDEMLAEYLNDIYNGVPSDAKVEMEDER